MLNIKVGDQVLVRSGKDKKKRGRVIAISIKEKKAIVSGVMIVSKHVKPRKVGDQSGIVKTESAINCCKLQLVCPNCNSPTRVGHRFSDDGTKFRVCKKCKQDIVKK